MSRIITLKTCANSFEAQLLKTKLESEGIPAAVVDENMGTIYGNAVQSFNPRVIVGSDFEEQARAILKECGDL